MITVIFYVLLSLIAAAVVIVFVFIVGTTEGVHCHGFWSTAKRLFWNELIVERFKSNGD